MANKTPPMAIDLVAIMVNRIIQPNAPGVPAKAVALPPRCRFEYIQGYSVGIYDHINDKSPASIIEMERLATRIKEIEDTEDMRKLCSIIGQHQGWQDAADVLTEEERAHTKHALEVDAELEEKARAEASTNEG